MKTFLFLSCLLGSSTAHAQESLGNDGANTSLIASLKALSAAENDTVRDSLSATIKITLRAALEADDALTHAFNDVPMSHVDAPDGLFRLFTWNVPHSDGSHRYEGFLLVQDEARRTLYELRDMTEKIPNPTVPALSAKNWYGALYYQVIPVKKGRKTYYTLLGWKGFSQVETRKVIEVLSFKGTAPVFGAPLFGDGKLKRMREVFAYSFQVAMSLKWDPVNKGIVLDHLAPMKPDLQGQAAFTGPDLSFDAYVWYKGRWAFLRDVDARNNELRPRNQPPKEP